MKVNLLTHPYFHEMKKWDSKKIEENQAGAIEIENKLLVFSKTFLNFWPKKTELFDYRPIFFKLLNSLFKM